MLPFWLQPIRFGCNEFGLGEERREPDALQAGIVLQRAAINL
jgi:hypothetical protein